jgi:hypothetical protein
VVEEDVAWLLNCGGLYLLTQGESGPARPLHERALDLRRSRLGDNHPDTLESASNLANDLWALGHHEHNAGAPHPCVTRLLASCSLPPGQPLHRLSGSRVTLVPSRSNAAYKERGPD